MAYALGTLDVATERQHWSVGRSGRCHARSRFIGKGERAWTGGGNHRSQPTEVGMHSLPWSDMGRGFSGYSPDFSKANLPHLQPIPTPLARDLPPEFGPLTPEIRNRPVFRQVRPDIVGLTQNEAGAPIFEPDELAPGQVVVLESKSRPGNFRHMVVDEVDELGQLGALALSAGAKVPSGGEEGERIFQLQSPGARQFVRLDDGVLYESVNPELVEEVNLRMEAARYGFANPYWFGPPLRLSALDTSVTIGFLNAESYTTGSLPKPLPKLDRRKDRRTLYMMGGGPSSGKSTMLMADAVDVPIGDEGIQVNADDIKTYLPEYVGLMEADQRRAASFVHEESSQISTRMIRESPTDKHVVLDGVGDKGAGSVENRLKTARSRGQRTIANYATLPTEMAVRLSAARGEETGRYVPEDYIRRAHADVTDTFFDLAKAKSLDELYLWNTELWDAEAEGGDSETDLQSSGWQGSDSRRVLAFGISEQEPDQAHSYESISALTDSGFRFPAGSALVFASGNTDTAGCRVGKHRERPRVLAAAGNAIMTWPRR